ncbi:MMPL family transporter [Intrasporangium sp.]|uniref:MMPL family transporter n=1 Tax=Intrasporangium sp. TaxID=1925024 RepID=UPI00293A8202|nr:MMPL family transporter [Intrasporangium sp.]MDV3221006.1 MMPL family transporter [Intrasporangium sp.]
MERLALACQRLRYVVVIGWLAVVVGLSILSSAFGGDVSDDYALPGSESHRAAELLDEAGFDFRAGTQAQLVFRVAPGADTPAFREQVDSLTDRVGEAIPEARVVSPFAPEGSRQVSPDGTIAYVAVELPTLPAEDLADVQESLAEIRASQDTPAFEIGGVMVDQDAESGPPSEMIGILAAMVILLFAFGSVIAMGLPILVGIIGAASGVAVVGIGARWVEMPSFAAPVAAMIAIGVGIDYALLVVTRYRESLQSGAEPTEAIVKAQTTAGRSVLFAGVTVVIASLGLVLMDLKLITGVALGIAGAVLITMLAAVTLLPAMLAFAGRRIDRLSVHRRSKPADADGGLARRWSRQVQRHPWPWAAVATLLLVLMSLPALDMRLGFSDAGTRPEGDTAREAYDLMSEGFGPGSSGPLVVVARVPSGQGEQALARLSQDLGETEGVAQVSPPVLSERGDIGIMQVIPTTGPRDAATTDLVHRLRDDVVPAADANGSLEVVIGGTTAAAVDFADYTADRLPLFLAVVLGLAMLLLLAVFRGVPVALKAVVVNLLSIGAAFGATVAVFQWGWGVDLLGLGASAPIEAWAPMMLIAIVFGLSMDYEVFLLSRIKEEYEHSRDNASAVAEGLARTARVITAAAAIMVCVFGSFVLGSSRELQLFGFGLAFAVLVDATVVRMVLVPSVMEILGDRNWWLPGWLDRVLPRFEIESVSRQGKASERREQGTPVAP